MWCATGQGCRPTAPANVHPAALILYLPLALDGESVAETGGNGTAIAIVSAMSIVFGYLLLAALWRFVFSEKARNKRKKR
jgi:hypothetical protein